jgi:ubiquinone/menaquinone biosynthesis C-methylase UbiE
MKENGIANPERRLFNCYGENMNNIPDNFADVIYSYQVLEHVQDIDRVLLETKRILKPKSIAYFTMPNYNSIYEGHYEILWIPYVLSKSKKLAKLYLKFINRNPSYVDWLNFTTPTYIRKKAEKVFKKDNIYLLPWGIRYLGILNKYIYAVGLLNFYIKLKIRGKDINQLKENKRMIFPFIKNNELFNNIWLLNLLLVITSIILFIFQPFVPDFRLIIINDD